MLAVAYEDAVQLVSGCQGVLLAQRGCCGGDGETEMMMPGGLTTLPDGPMSFRLAPLKLGKA